MKRRQREKEKRRKMKKKERREEREKREEGRAGPLSDSLMLCINSFDFPAARVRFPLAPTLLLCI